MGAGVIEQVVAMLVSHNVILGLGVLYLFLASLFPLSPKFPLVSPEIGLFFFFLTT